MTKHDRHIFLYAKGHYKKGDLIEDLQKIIGERCCLLPQHVSHKDIYVILLRIVWNYINDKDNFVRFMSDIKGFSYYNMIKACLSEIRFTNIVDIPFELGEPDEKILPLKEVVNSVRLMAGDSSYGK